MLLFENIKLALAAIRANKMRSFLTMLGIIIGISSVIAITSIGDSARAAVGKEFESFGKNAIMIYVNWSMVEDYIQDDEMISSDDIDALKAKFPNDLEYAYPYVYTTSDVKHGNATGKFDLTGVGPNYNNFKKMNIIHGRMINEADVKSGADKVVIDEKTAINYFNKSNVIGKTLPFLINGDSRDLTIVGVYKVESTIFSQMNGQGSYLAYVPYTLVMIGDKTSTIEAFLADGSDIAVCSEKIKSYLQKIKNTPPEFYMIESAEQQLSMMDTMLGTLSIAIGAIAAISLAVGGIGIMNIMLVSVTERTREIGIRKSLGARTQDVLQQFLIEATILSIIGGMIGTILGLGIAAVGMKIAGVEMVMNPMVVVIAVGFSALVGMFFGFYPARKAAKLDPIEALRYE